MSRNRLAYAVFCRGRLDFFTGKTLRQYRTARDRNRGLISILKQLVLTHSIRSVSVPRLNKQQRKSSDLLSLYRAVARFCATRGLDLQVQDAVQARRHLVGDRRPSKANARGHLIGVFPELRRYARGDSEWERRYYDHVFTAIACGLAAIGTERTEQ